MKTKLYLLISSLLVSFFFGTYQSNAETLQSNAETLILEGWGVRSEHPGFVGPTTAFHFSPDGSFYEIPDAAGFTLKIGVQIKAIKSITGAKIPIDAFCHVRVFVDGVGVDDFGNQHKDILVNFTPGVHNILIVNDCCSDPSCWMGITVGKCLWGTNKAIKFVQTYMQ